MKTADIIVFSESTLNLPDRPAIVPKAEEKCVPCGNDKYPEEVTTASCAAKDAKKYVVVNLYMQQDCKEQAAEDTRPCFRDNINIYNTAVAFDRHGMVIAV